MCLLMYIGWAASTSIVFGEYTLRAFNMDPTHWQLRLAGFACITFCLLLHGTALKWGLRVQNVLGVFKIIILVVVIITGFLALGGHMKVEKPDNFRNMFNGTTTSASSFCSSLYNVGPLRFALDSSTETKTILVRSSGPLLDSATSTMRYRKSRILSAQSG